MKLGKIIGTVVADTKIPDYASKKVLVVQPLDADLKPSGKSFLAVDAVQAGIGDFVLTIEEGNSARQVINNSNELTIKTVIAAIVDDISK